MRQFNGTFEQNIPEPFLNESSDVLSESARRHALLVGEVVELYVKEHFPNIDPDKVDYGALFDKFYDKKISQLRILKEMYKL